VTTAESSNQIFAPTFEAGAKYKMPDVTVGVNEIIDPSAFKSYAEVAVPKSNGKVILMNPAFPSPLSKFTASLNPVK